ncbi:MAG: glycosyltransferase [Candidatus Omnitrophica bacterium]|nr:glycosyltransferase [Candidatus Omnitrophota bacterium]
MRKRLGIPPGAYVIGYSGRFSPEKNLEFLARAVFQFLAREENAHFVLIGSGSLEKEIRQIATIQNIKSRVHFAGIQRGEKLVAAYHALDVFAFASISETQGMVVTEAMAAGIPVVAIDSPGVREVVRDRQNGRLLASCNGADFARALFWCYRQDKQAWSRLKKGARKTAKQFSIERTSREALEVYQDAIAAKKKKELAPPPRGIRSLAEKGTVPFAWSQATSRLKVEKDLFMRLVKAAFAVF